ncbi:NAD(P)/FAD-dependent oxidoreductase [Gordonia sp. ABSL11-1]|uniref:flavin-containing monooxygenase n=1 Tax=Gordonia sp. ABSL11-1 TaxID=3053924 RepID=UPI0025728CEA|nr:NAD(P)/FAD-dependent oxidoreductase [Gordonia sp. ABSL11-1]MDL9948138.1 NAD(P)/FAD-dependent oxidoreductase [Gordonia sp. ABSL11-1]
MNETLAPETSLEDLRVRGPQAQPLPETGSVALHEAVAHAVLLADIGVLVALLGHFTRDTKYLGSEYRTLVAAFRTPAGTPDPDLRNEVLREGAGLLVDLVTRQREELLERPDDAYLLRLYRTAVGSDAPGPEYAARVVYDLGLEAEAEWSDEARARAGRITVTVIGAGSSGLHLSRRLRDLGFNVVVLEKNTDVGGTWWVNRYPGVGLDSQAHRYLTSDAPMWPWTRFFAKRDEILDRIRDYADTHGLRSLIRFGHHVRSIAWDEESRRWRLGVTIGSGDETVLDTDFVVTAVGGLGVPRAPDVPGLASFSGEVVHTARWRDDLDLTGLRIGLIGTGSSGTQVAAGLAERGSTLTVFQRSPGWISPSRTPSGAVAEGVQWLLRHVPFYAEWYRLVLFWTSGDSRRQYVRIDPQWSGPGVSEANAQSRQELLDYLDSKVGNRPDLLGQLTPDYPPFTKRMVVDSGFLDTLQRDNVTLVSDPIDSVIPAGVRTADGQLHELDLLVTATGFHATRFLWPIELFTRTGQPAAQVWGGEYEARAYLGITLAGFPNFFALRGPNGVSPHGGSGVADIGESATNYIVSALRQVAQHDLRTIEVRKEVLDAYNADIESRLVDYVWSTAGVNSWYKTPRGRLALPHPWSLQEFWLLSRTADLDDYDVTTR